MPPLSVVVIRPPVIPTFALSCFTRGHTLVAASIYVNSRDARVNNPYSNCRNISCNIESISSEMVKPLYIRSIRQFLYYYFLSVSGKFIMTELMPNDSVSNHNVSFYIIIIYSKHVLITLIILRLCILNSKLPDRYEIQMSNMEKSTFK